MVKQRKCRVAIFKKSGSTWSGTESVVTGVYDVQVKRGIGKIKDVFSFRVLNSQNRLFDGSSDIEEDDKCRIWFWSDTVWDDMNAAARNAVLEIEGIVKTIKQTTTGGHEVLVNGVGLMDVVFRGLVFVRDSSLTTPETIIQDVIKQLNEYNPQRTIYGKDSTEWGNMNNKVTGNDIQYTSAYKSAAEVIEELSSAQYTGDGAYKFQVKYNATETRYEFLWTRKSRSEDQTMTEGTTVMKRVDLQQSNEEIVNAIIYNVGPDCNEITWDFLAYDPTSQVSDGANWLYYTDSADILPNLIKDEQINNDTLFDKDAQGRFTSNYPNSYDNNGGEWTFQFETRNDAGVKSGTAATATNATTYNEKLVNEAEWAGREKAMKIIDTWGKSIWSGDIEVGQTSTYTEGELIKLTASSYNLTNHNIRCQEIWHNVWSTLIKVKDDEKSIVYVTS